LEAACPPQREIYKHLFDLNDFGFRVQITRFSLSIPSNITEGMEYTTAKDKVRFLDISLHNLEPTSTLGYTLVMSVKNRQSMDRRNQGNLSDAGWPNTLTAN
jgi:four helix bundle protein